MEPPPNNPNTVQVNEVVEPVVDKEGPLSANTYNQYAYAKMDMLLRDPMQSPPQREALIGQVRQLFQQALAVEPTNVDAYIGLESLYQHTGEVEKRLEIERKLIEMHGNNGKVWERRAVRLAQERKFDQAAEAYQKAHESDPDNRMYRIHLGFTLARAKRYEEGYKWLANSMREPEARCRLAQMMLHNQDLVQARQQLQYALQIDPQHAEARQMLLSLTTAETNTPGMGDPATLPAPLQGGNFMEPVPTGMSR
ncbi:MAG: tetratricopeptide repeat protein [Zavarzinella sp.]